MARAHADRMSIQRRTEHGACDGVRQPKARAVGLFRTQGEVEVEEARRDGRSVDPRTFGGLKH